MAMKTKSYRSWESDRIDDQDPLQTSGGHIVVVDFLLSLSASMVKVGCTLQRTGKKGKKHADYYGTAVYWLKGGKKKRFFEFLACI